MGTMAQYFEEQGRQQAAMKIARQLIASDVDRNIVKASTGLSDKDLYELSRKVQSHRVQ